MLKLRMLKGLTATNVKVKRHELQKCCLGLVFLHQFSRT